MPSVRSTTYRFGGLGRYRGQGRGEREFRFLSYPNLPTIMMLRLWAGALSSLHLDGASHATRACASVTRSTLIDQGAILLSTLIGLRSGVPLPDVSGDRDYAWRP